MWHVHFTEYTSKQRQERQQRQVHLLTALLLAAISVNSADDTVRTKIDIMKT